MNINTDKKVRYLCPNCWRDMGIKVITPPKIIFTEAEDIEVESDDVVSNIELVYDKKVYYDIFGYCKNCGYGASKYDGPFIEIDEGMVEIVQVLNRKGYQTKFCCEGHSLDGSDIPYIIFKSTWDDSMYNNDIIPMIPDDWEVYRYNDYEDESFTGIYEISMYCNNIAYCIENDIDYLDELLVFVNQLPKNTHNRL